MEGFFREEAEGIDPVVNNPVGLFPGNDCFQPTAVLKFLNPGSDPGYF
jgi:hypothetical protein